MRQAINWDKEPQVLRPHVPQLEEMRGFPVDLVAGGEQRAVGWVAVYKLQGVRSTPARLEENSMV